MKTASNNATADRKLFSEEILSLCLYYRDEQESRIFSQSSSSVALKWKAERETLRDYDLHSNTQESVSVDLFTMQVCKRLRAAGRDDLSESYKTERGETLSDPVKQTILRAYLRARSEAGSRAEQIEALISNYRNTADRRSCLDREISKLTAPIDNTTEDLYYYDLKLDCNGDGDLIDKLSDRFSCLLRSQHRETDQQDLQEVFTFFYRKILREQLETLRKKISDGRSFSKRTTIQGKQKKAPVDLLDAKVQMIFSRAIDLGLLRTEDCFSDQAAGKKITNPIKAYFIKRLFLCVEASHIDESPSWSKYAPFFGEEAKSMGEACSRYKNRGYGDPKLRELIDRIFEDLS